MTKLCNERYEEIKQMVVDFIKYYEIKCVPVNGFEIANKIRKRFKLK